MDTNHCEGGQIQRPQQPFSNRCKHLHFTALGQFHPFSWSQWRCYWGPPLQEHEHSTQWCRSSSPEVTSCCPHCGGNSDAILCALTHANRGLACLNTLNDTHEVMEQSLGSLLLPVFSSEEGVEAVELPTTCLPFSFRECSGKIGVWKKAFLWVLESQPVLFLPK